MKRLLVFAVALSLAIALVPGTSAQTANPLPTPAQNAERCLKIEAYGGSTRNPDNSAALAAAFNIGSSAKGANYPIGISVGSTAGGGTITGNLFDNMVIAVFLDSASTGGKVQSNEYSNDSTLVKNLGTGNTVGGGSP